MTTRVCSFSDTSLYATCRCIQHGTWKFTTKQIADSLTSITDGVLPKFIEKTSLAELNSVTGLMRKIQGGEGPGNLKPYCTNAFLTTIMNSIKNLMSFPEPQNGMSCLFVLTCACRVQVRSSIVWSSFLAASLQATDRVSKRTAGWNSGQAVGLKGICLTCLRVRRKVCADVFVWLQVATRSTTEREAWIVRLRVCIRASH